MAGRYGSWYGSSIGSIRSNVLFKDKFTQEERDSGLTNIVMGLSFITEGAIPFGAADPARAIPSFIAGSALTGALVGLAGLNLWLLTEESSLSLLHQIHFFISCSY